MTPRVPRGERSVTSLAGTAQRLDGDRTSARRAQERAALKLANRWGKKFGQGL
jgi:hypothetical protein